MYTGPAAVIIDSTILAVAAHIPVILHRVRTMAAEYGVHLSLIEFYVERYQ